MEAQQNTTTFRRIKSKQRQMYLYAPAIFESYGKYPDKYVFVFFRDRSKSIVIDHNSKDLEKTLEWAEKTMELIEKEEEYKASPDQFFCNNLCGFRNICEFKI
jgi:hypothetical protein